MNITLTSVYRFLSPFLLYEVLIVSTKEIRFESAEILIIGDALKNGLEILMGYKDVPYKYLVVGSNI